MVKKRYLFFDIDGTLAAGGYGNTYIPESAKKALEKLREAGHFLCIATGRAQAMAIDYMKELGFENMISDGGYSITINGNLLGITSLPKDKIVALIDECEEKNIPWGLQVDNSDTRLFPDERFENITHDTYMKIRIVPGLNPRNYDTFYKAYIVCPYPVEKTLKALKDLPWNRFFNDFFFVEPSDKAFGINKVLQHFGAKPKDAIVFGDGINDLSMFTDDGWIRVAMGNAVPALKEKADFITTDVDKDGIYNACEKLGLFEPVTES